MADINVERKSSMAWLWWLLALLAIALIAWLLLAGDDEEVAVEPAPVVAPVADAPPPVPVAQGPLTIADVLANPGANIGSTVTTPNAVRVTEVISDRGFWIEENGARMFVMINEGTQQNPQPGTADVQGMPAEMPDVNQGDMIQITEAMVHDGTTLQNLQGPVDEQARQVASGQQAFLVTDGRNIRKM